MRGCRFIGGAAALFLVACGPPRVAERLPNGDFFTAQYLQAPALLEAKSRPGELAFFRLSAPKSTHIRWRVSGPASAVPWELQFYDSGRRLMKTVNLTPDSWAGPVEGLVPSGDGSVYALVGGGGARGRYDLEIRALRLENTEAAPNATLREAAALPAGRSMSGALEPGVAHWFRITSEFLNDRSLGVSVTGVRGLDLDLELLDAGGGHLFRVDGNGPDEGESVRRLVLPGRSWIYAKVTAKNNMGSGSPFTVSTSIEEVQRNGEREPNGTPSLATPWLPGEAFYEGEIGWRGDRDVYVLNDAVPDVRTALGVEGPAGVPLAFEVWSKDRRLLASETAGTNGNPVTWLENLGLGPDPVYVAVFSPEGRGRPGLAYRLRRIRTAWPNTEAKPDHLPVQANPLAPGAELEATLSGSGDQAWFRAPATGGPWVVDLRGADADKVRLDFVGGEPDAARKNPKSRTDAKAETPRASSDHRTLSWPDPASTRLRLSADGKEPGPRVVRLALRPAEAGDLKAR